MPQSQVLHLATVSLDLRRAQFAAKPQHGCARWGRETQSRHLRELGDDEEGRRDTPGLGAEARASRKGP